MDEISHRDECDAAWVAKGFPGVVEWSTRAILAGVEGVTYRQADNQMPFDRVCVPSSVETLPNGDCVYRYAVEFHDIGDGVRVDSLGGVTDWTPPHLSRCKPALTPKPRRSKSGGTLA
jgi:hypothetical protein